jgi:dsDNA-binding SOS-regulon protein
MAVITRFVVVRQGVELDKVFTVKREAEAYDKMLDAAENLAEFIRGSAGELGLNEQLIEDLSVFLAKNGPEVARILKGVKPAPVNPPGSVEAEPVKKEIAAEKKKKPASSSRRKGK